MGTKTSTRLGGILTRLRAFGTPDEDELEKRLRIQRIVYLLQVGFRVKLGYRFDWSLRGPYAPELAADIASVLREKNFQAVAFKNADVELRFKEFENFMAGRALDAQWLEYAAALIREAEREKLTPEELVDRTVSAHRRLAHDHAQGVLNELLKAEVVGVTHGAS